MVSWGGVNVKVCEGAVFVIMSFGGCFVLGCWGGRGGCIIQWFFWWNVVYLCCLGWILARLLVVNDVVIGVWVGIIVFEL
jgi:hypothetical protein